MADDLGELTAFTLLATLTALTAIVSDHFGTDDWRLIS